MHHNLVKHPNSVIQTSDLSGLSTPTKLGEFIFAPVAGPIMDILGDNDRYNHTLSIDAISSSPSCSATPQSPFYRAFLNRIYLVERINHFFFEVIESILKDKGFVLGNPICGGDGTDLLLDCKSQEEIEFVNALLHFTTDKVNELSANLPQKVNFRGDLWAANILDYDFEKIPSSVLSLPPLDHSLQLTILAHLNKQFTALNHWLELYETAHSKLSALAETNPFKKKGKTNRNGRGPSSVATLVACLKEKESFENGANLPFHLQAAPSKRINHVIAVKIEDKKNLFDVFGKLTEFVSSDVRCGYDYQVHFIQKIGKILKLVLEAEKRHIVINTELLNAEKFALESKLKEASSGDVRVTSSLGGPKFLQIAVSYPPNSGPSIDYRHQFDLTILKNLKGLTDLLFDDKRATLKLTEMYAPNGPNVVGIPICENLNYILGNSEPKPCYTPQFYTTFKEISLAIN